MYVDFSYNYLLRNVYVSVFCVLCEVLLINPYVPMLIHCVILHK